ncbi:MAG TPA: TIGR03067 domain-containing protein [Bryobacteraceae bacterium]|nr:TIGR03067 domain-containing protein [Bryobacteraceae bacterium]
MSALRLSVFGSLLVVWSASLVGCGATHAAGASDDAKLWQGTWKLVSCTWNGEPQMADMQWIVEGDRYTIRLNGQSHTDPYPFILDPSQKHIDVNHHETPQGTYGGKLKGIYEITGDSLRVCYDLTGRQYPRSFDGGPGTRQVLYQFQRP